MSRQVEALTGAQKEPLPGRSHLAAAQPEKIEDDRQKGEEVDKSEGTHFFFATLLAALFFASLTGFAEANP